MPYYNPRDIDPNHNYTEDDYERMADNVADWSPLSNIPRDERKKAAKSLGANWACVMSGIGDQ